MERLDELHDAVIDADRALTALQETYLWADLPLDVRRILCHARVICAAAQAGIEQASDA